MAYGKSVEIVTLEAFVVRANSGILRNGKIRHSTGLHAFLLEHLQSQEPFTIGEFVAATEWDQPGTFKTYLRKQPFKISDTERYRVTESFRKLVAWRKFKQHVPKFDAL
ncbi:MAG: hypothetical protein LC776_15985 [Acidobacteria bacterium]|nr:hypothetical protein [Acidobacteriota bacterium]